MKRLIQLLGLFVFIAVPSRAQWLTQRIDLHPGWNAIHLHVDATHDSLENLVGAASPISEIWLWRPSMSDGRIINNPLQPVSGSDWVQWTKVAGPAGVFSLRA